MADIAPLFGGHASAVHGALADLFRNDALRKLAPHGLCILEEEVGEARRTVLIGLLRLTEWEAGVVLPAEETEETNSLPCPLCAAFSDPRGETETRMAHLMRGTPRAEHTENGVTRRLWAINDILALEAFRADFSPRKASQSETACGGKPPFRRRGSSFPCASLQNKKQPLGGKPRGFLRFG